MSEEERLRARERAREWARKHPERMRERLQKWRIANKARMHKKATEYTNRRRSVDPAFRVITNLRSRVKGAVKKAASSKAKKTTELIGCSVDQLRAHLESQFTRHMTWENYGTYWHIDHIIPCAAFDLSVPGQQEACFHWTNMQPLKASENLRKHDKITQPQMSLRMVL